MAKGSSAGQGLLREHRGDDDHDRREDAATQGLGAIVLSRARSSRHSARDRSTAGARRLMAAS